MTDIEKRASELGLSPEAMKMASVLEGFAILGFNDEIDKIAAMSKEAEKKEDKKDKKGDKKDLPPFIKKKMDAKDGKNGDDKDEKKNGKEDKKDKKGEKEEDKDKKKKDKEEEKSSADVSDFAAEQFTAGFEEALKEAGLMAAAKKISPYLAPVLGLGGIGTGMYALSKQKEATKATRAGVQRMGAGVAGALGQLASQQRYNTMRDISNETRLARGMNQNRAVLLSHLKSGPGGK
jgi:hypothetical protein